MNGRNERPKDRERKVLGRISSENIKKPNNMGRCRTRWAVPAHRAAARGPEEPSNFQRDPSLSNLPPTTRDVDGIWRLALGDHHSSSLYPEAEISRVAANERARERNARTTHARTHARITGVGSRREKRTGRAVVWFRRKCRRIRIWGG